MQGWPKTIVSFDQSKNASFDCSKKPLVKLDMFKISSKMIKNENFKKVHDFGGFQSPAMKKKKYIYSKISILGFQVCSQKYRRMTKDFFFTFGL